METMVSLLFVGIGLLLRLALPIAITFVLVYCLRKLDARWQLEASKEPLFLEKPECWKIKNCHPEQQANCVARTSSLPCWQVFRLPNGYLREECISCRVFSDAPVPTLQTKPRRI